MSVFLFKKKRIFGLTLPFLIKKSNYAVGVSNKKIEIVVKNKALFCAYFDQPYFLNSFYNHPAFCLSPILFSFRFTFANNIFQWFHISISRGISVWKMSNKYGIGISPYLMAFDTDMNAERQKQSEYAIFNAKEEDGQIGLAHAVLHWQMSDASQTRCCHKILFFRGMRVTMSNGWPTMISRGHGRAIWWVDDLVWAHQVVGMRMAQF